MNRDVLNDDVFLNPLMKLLASRLMTSPAVRSMTESAQPVFNTTITNVPGPQTPLYFAGAQLVKFNGPGPTTDGMGIIHPIFSYMGQISVSFTSCREVMPDPEVYAGFLQESFEELKRAAVG